MKKLEEHFKRHKKKIKANKKIRHIIRKPKNDSRVDYKLKNIILEYLVAVII